MQLIDYIDKHHSGNQAAFARACVVSPAQVTQWIKSGFIAHNGRLYSPKGAEKDFVTIKKKVYQARKQKLSALPAGKHSKKRSKKK